MPWPCAAAARAVEPLMAKKRARNGWFAERKVLQFECAFVVRRHGLRGCRIARGWRKFGVHHQRPAAHAGKSGERLDKCAAIVGRDGELARIAARSRDRLRLFLSADRRPRARAWSGRSSGPEIGCDQDVAKRLLGNAASRNGRASRRHYESGVREISRRWLRRRNPGAFLHSRKRVARPSKLRPCTDRLCAPSAPS